MSKQYNGIHPSCEPCLSCGRCMLCGCLAHNAQRQPRFACLDCTRTTAEGIKTDDAMRGATFVLLKGGKPLHEPQGKLRSMLTPVQVKAFLEGRD